MKFGTVALYGRTNVGKSTFLNAALGQRLAIVSSRPQTTRDAMLGVVRHGDAQLAFLDTPGLHRPRTELGRRMVATAVDAARTADVVALFTDLTRLSDKGSRLPAAARREGGDSPLPQSELSVIAELPPGKPVVLVINKIDLLRDKSALLPVLDAFSHAYDFAAYVPVSVTRADGVERVLDELAALVPEGPPGFADDVLTNRPTAWFAAEYVREQVLQLLYKEVPHAVAVAIDDFREGPRGVRIQATIHVEKVGQRAILLGSGGATIKEIGRLSRESIAELVGGSVHLELFVRVTPRWKDMPRQLAELGYAAPDLSASGAELGARFAELEFAGGDDREGDDDTPSPADGSDGEDQDQDGDGEDQDGDGDDRDGDVLDESDDSEEPPS